MPSIKLSQRGQEQTVALDKDEVLIGRGADCDIQLVGNSISRRHARLWRDGAGWRVADLGSRNGTRVNDLPGTDKLLEDGDRIHLPDTVLSFVDERAPRTAPSPLVDAPVDPATRTMFRTAVDFAALASAQPRGPAADPAASERLQRLVRVVSGAARAVLSSRSLDEVFQRMLDLVFEHLPVQRGFVMLREPAGRELVTKCSRHGGGSGGNLTFSRTIAEQVCRDRVGVLTLDAQADDRFARGESILALGIRSAMAAPVWHGDTVEGLICVDNSQRSRAFDEFDLDLLSALGNHLAVALEQARLQQVALEKEKLDRELSVAREIQMGVLPRSMPPVAGYDLAGTSRPAEQTGGDIYDLVPLDDSRLILLLGDATGHGVGPALSVTQVRSMLRIALRLGADLDAAFVQINNQLCQDLADNRFVTAFLGVLDRRTHELRYHAGGQGPLLHFHAASGECEWRKATTLPLGLIEASAASATHTLRLEPGDVVGLITDGVFEYENPQGEQFQLERAGRVVESHQAEPMARLVELLLQAVCEFGGTAPQNDDITIVLVRRLPD